MKPVIFALLLTCFATVGFSQRVQSSCTAPDSIVSLYKEDAAKAALNLMIQRDSSFLDSLIISQPLQDSLLMAMVAIYNSGSEAALAATGREYFDNPINEIEGYLFVHQDYPTSLRKIRLQLDTSILWEKKLFTLNLPTGFAAIDSFIADINLSIDTAKSSNYGAPTAWLMTDTFQNTIFIAKKWDEISNNLTNAGANFNPIFSRGGGRIQATLTDTSVMMDYSEAWGDCPSGCIFAEYWSFAVFPGCSVTIVSWGGDAGTPSKVEEIKETLTGTFYPNPASDKITIETPPLSKIEIIDITGNILKEIHSNSDQDQIDVSKLPSGIYLIKVTDKKGNISMAKFVKE